MFRKKPDDKAPRRRSPERVSEPADTARPFRLGRTLTGSSSSRIVSSNELNAEFASPRAKIHHLVNYRRRIFSRLITVSAICVVLYLFIGQLIATVHIQAKVDSSAVALGDSRANMYLGTVDDYFARRINERFAPNLNVNDLTNYMQVSHPEVESLDLKPTSGFGAAQLELHMRRPVARWVVYGKTQFVNRDGIVFEKNYYSDPKVEIVDKNATELSGGLVASNRFLSFVGQVVGDLKENHLQVTKAIIPVLTTRQLELHIKGVKPYFKLTVDRSAGEQSEDIARIVRHLKKKGIKPSYVDVRIKGKAFYK